ncbi:MAG: hypothetical protein J6B71_02910, partial [Clostridia bacterium]|nr:hypothetical protein [Clostridia bacterium]
EGEGTTTPPKYTWATQGGDGTAASPLIINQTNFVDFYNYYLQGGWNAFTEANEYFKLGSDIVVNEGDAVTWGTTAPAVVFNAPMSEFLGTLDGDGHTISGLCIKTTTMRAALFNQMAYGSVVENLRVTNSYFEYAPEGDATWNYNSVATIAARLNGGLIENCYSDAILVCNYSTSATAIMVGGFVGMANEADSKVNACVFAGQIVAPMCRAGGIVGTSNNGGTDKGTRNVLISNCLNLGSVKGERAGAILGTDENCQNSTSAINKCINLSKEIYVVKNGTETLANYLYGGIIGLTIDTYVIEEFATTAPEGGLTGIVATHGHTTGVDVDAEWANVTTTTKTLAEFLALTATDFADWNFKANTIPCPIEGLEIALADYLTKWGITLN